MKTTVKAAVSAGLLALLLVVLPWQDVETAVSRLPASVWLGVLAGFVSGHLVGVLKWRLLVRAGRADLGVLDAARCYGAGLFANVCLPTLVGGDVLRAVLAGRATGRLEAAFLAGLADRVIDVATLAVLIVAGGLLAGGALPGWSGEAVTAGAAILAVVLAAASPLLLRRPLARWPRRLRRPVARGLVSLRRLVKRPGPALGALALSLAIQTGFVLLNVWIGRAIGIDLPVAVWFVAWPLAKIAGLLPISLGGLAVRDATFGALLVPLGVPMAHGVVAHLAWQTVMVAGGLAGGAAWWALSRREPAAGARTWRGLLALAPRSHG